MTRANKIGGGVGPSVAACNDVVNGLQTLWQRVEVNEAIGTLVTVFGKQLSSLCLVAKPVGLVTHDCVPLRAVCSVLLYCVHYGASAAHCQYLFRQFQAMQLECNVGARDTDKNTWCHSGAYHLACGLRCNTTYT